MSTHDDTSTPVREGDVIEFTLHGERRTGDVMLVTDDGVALLDLLDDDRPAWARIEQLTDLVVFSPDEFVVVA